MANGEPNLLTQLENFTKAGAEFTWALTVYAIHQGGSVFKGLPTTSPTAEATADFKTGTSCLTEVFDPVDQTIFNTPNTVQQAAIDVAFNFLKPQNYTPKTIVTTGTNVARWGLGIAAQLIPGGQVGNGGKPVGWGPVNREDAELF